MPDLARLKEFAEFCRLKVGVNGPDVHMKAAVIGTEDAGDERAWRLAVYNCFCSTPPAAAVWARWPLEEAQIVNVDRMERWCRTNWAGVPIRKNRRPMRSVPKLAHALMSTANWMYSDFWRLQEMSYEEAWDSLDAVWSWGRYVKIKFLETMRSCYPQLEHLEAPNIRSAGGWSPRAALAVMYPEYAEEVTSKSGNTKLIVGGKRNHVETLAVVHAIADEVRAYVGSTGTPVSNYQLEALLCNYRQSLSGTFYPGRTIDSELEYHAKAVEHFGSDPYLGTFDFFGTRHAAFPPQCLGELNGWSGVRKDLWTVLRDYGYTWSDVKYNYWASASHLEYPVPGWVAV